VNHRKNFPVEGGGRALAGGNGPGHGPRQPCQLHSLVGVQLLAKNYPSRLAFLKGYTIALSLAITNPL
jgi:hypothetical protein